jgi:hypothetical protein
VNAIQLLYPELAYVFETDRETARRSRERLLAVEPGDARYVGTSHLTEPFVPVPPASV